MSRTIRKEKGTDRTYPEGQNNKYRIRYICNCSYCTGVSKKKLQEKIAKKEMMKEIKEYSSIG